MTRSSRCATDPAPGVKAEAAIARPEHIRPDEVGDPAPRTSQTKRKTIRQRPRTDHSKSPRRLKSHRPTAAQIADAEMPGRNALPEPKRYQRVQDFGFFKLVLDVDSKAQIFYVEWYDKRAHQTRRRSLQTNANNIAQDKIGRIVRSGIEGDPKALLDEGVCSDIAGVLDDYEKSHPDLASASQTHTAINHLKNHIGDIRIDNWTKQDFRKFEKDFLALGYKKTYLSRICAVLRAALNEAEDDEKIARAPNIPEVCSDADKDASPLKGRLVTTKEIAQLFDEVNELHFLDYLIGEINSASRPITMLESETTDIDWQHGVFDLNPAGRVQTKKYRPVVRITNTWQPWLKQAPPGRLITFNGKPVQSVKKAFRAARNAAGLKPDSSGIGFNSYSIRHTIGRYLEACDVPPVEISILLGHAKIDRKKITDRYSPLNCRGPFYLRKATAAIEKFVREINEHTKKWDLLIPYAKKPGYQDKRLSPQRRRANGAEKVEPKNPDHAEKAPAADYVEGAQLSPVSTPDGRS